MEQITKIETKIQFERYDWLIRKWKNKHGGEYDLALFIDHINDKNFSFCSFYRIKKYNRVELIGKGVTDYINGDRMKFEFRKCSKKEFRRFSEIILKSNFNI